MIYTVFVVVTLLWLWVSFRSQWSFMAESASQMWKSHRVTEYREELKIHFWNLCGAVVEVFTTILAIIGLLTWPIWFPIALILLALIAAIIE